MRSSANGGRAQYRAAYALADAMMAQRAKPSSIAPPASLRRAVSPHRDGDE